MAGVIYFPFELSHIVPYTYLGWRPLTSNLPISVGCWDPAAVPWHLLWMRLFNISENHLQTTVYQCTVLHDLACTQACILELSNISIDDMTHSGRSLMLTKNREVLGQCLAVLQMWKGRLRWLTNNKYLMYLLLRKRLTNFNSVPVPILGAMYDKVYDYLL